MSDQASVAIVGQLTCSISCEYRILCWQTARLCPRTWVRLWCASCS